ncbi:MAG: hypothetical protein DI563_13265 [Variovorax paradoxus]|uniref:Uncharacterized protein n=1 Tax=Variovorax paradoxus TaxID=34073 RepID=A0A2W5QAA7_VARPD|nr:MAG: hypothetical protein DI563_13265 [Variovorax paradoxus]
MNHEGSTFLSGAAASAAFFFFAKELDALVADDTPNASFFRFKAADSEAAFRKYDENVHWPAISMATVKPVGGERVVVAVGPQGDFWELFPASTNEVLGTFPVVANLRRLSVVDDAIYACGMDRAVFLRRGTGQWQSIGPGPAPADPPVVGFEDLGGFGEAEMYAVGWGGELWWRDHGTWRRADSPTNANLCALACAPDGTVHVVGHDGVMLRGRQDQWRLVDTGRRDILRDVAVLDGEVYVVSDFAIYRLGDAGLEADPDLVDDPPATCLHLLEAADGLVSLGQKDVFLKPAGGRWRRLV